MHYRYEKMLYAISFGDQVRERRLALGLTFAQLSQRLDWTPNVICSIAQGLYVVTLEEIYQITEALDCSAKDLFKRI